MPEAAQVVALLAARMKGSRGFSGAQPVSSVATHAERIKRWFEGGVKGVAIHAALVRDHGFTGHYSAVRRYLNKLKAGVPVEATMILDFAPGQAAQVDFGAGPTLLDPSSGKPVRAWFFVMTLCFSRHQYVEFVWDQSSETWQRCHHHALRHFGGVPAKPCCMTPISRRGDSQDSANRLDPKAAAVVIDEGPNHFKRRSSSAWAKKALASFRISLARLSSRTSRSSSLTRGALEGSSAPALRSALAIQLLSVCAVQPIFWATDLMAAHSES
jgi:hypothetical protein